MRAKKTLSILLAILIFSEMAYAYQFSPLSTEFATSGAASAKVYTVYNDSSSPVAVEVEALTREIDIDGNEINEDASAYFVIQPSKMIIKPGATQLVRVQYRGPKNVPYEQSFRIQANQIEYSLGAQAPQSGPSISFLFVYSTSAYVKPVTVVESIRHEAYINQAGKLEILIENTGTVHQLLNNLSITVNGNNGETYVLSADEMGIVNGGNLLCGSSLRIVIDVPEALADAESFQTTVSYDFSY